MALLRKDKEAVVADLSEALNNATSAVFVTVGALTVQDAADIRTQLRETDAVMRVVKKRLLALALKNVGADVDMTEVSGTFAVAYGNDDISPAKVLHTFAREHKEVDLAIHGGLLNGELLDAQRIKELATLPVLDQQRGMFVSVLAGSMRGFVGTLAAVPRSFVQTLVAVSEKAA